MKAILITICLFIFLGAAYYFIAPFFNIIEINDPLPKSISKQTEEIIETENINIDSLEEDLTITVNKEAEREAEEVFTTPPITKTNLVIATTGHPASGEVKVLQTNEGSVIRYENFSTINGPKLHLYLANDLDAEDYVDLGPIKGTQGDINYAVPSNIDLSEYKYVMYWCVPFGVLFNYVELQ